MKYVVDSSGDLPRVSGVPVDEAGWFESDVPGVDNVKEVHLSGIAMGSLFRAEQGDFSGIEQLVVYDPTRPGVHRFEGCKAHIVPSGSVEVEVTEVREMLPFRPEV
ncbi:MAG: hypothetical protein UX30_C0005G0002 [Candidatus Saccharibacteria bacterium GW2011_GWA2_46_10]|nr:MAG: hypothetical protein UX30_C0005G0002 [Candidatus Saccharibacteria bacterium GW2011_GWA2_46_10]